jgi:hypothetical protein
MNDLEVFLFKEEENGKWSLNNAYTTYRATITIIPEIDSNILHFVDLTPAGQKNPKVFQFSRLLTIAPFREILDEAQPMSYAGGNTSFPSYHIHRGTVNANLLSGEFSLLLDADISNFITYVIHGIGMLLLVGIGFPLGMVSHILT